MEPPCRFSFDNTRTFPAQEPRKRDHHRDSENHASFKECRPIVHVRPKSNSSPNSAFLAKARVPVGLCGHPPPVPRLCQPNLQRVACLISQEARLITM